MFSAMAEKYDYLSTEVTVDKYVLILEKTHFSIHITQGDAGKEAVKIHKWKPAPKCKETTC